MHSILIVVDKAPAVQHSAEWDKWQTFESHFSKFSMPATKRGRLTENVWLLDPENDVGLLATIISAAESGKIKYQILFVEKATEIHSKIVPPASVV